MSVASTDPRLVAYVVIAGDTRRYVEAASEDAALDAFYKDKPGRRLVAAKDELVGVRPATSAEIIEFHNRKRTPQHENQIALDLSDECKTPPTTAARRRTTKEHA